jgi:very-short-patch-repair endonuclease
MKIELEIKEEWIQENGKYKCPHCGRECSKFGIKNHIWRNHTEEGKQSCIELGKKVSGKNAPMYGKHHSLEKRKQISRSMKKAHQEGRANNWQDSKNYGDGSYPEQFFEKAIINNFNDKNFQREYRFFQYSIDFAWPNKKLAIEIDGSQHEQKNNKQRDIKKDKLLKENGWKVLRIKWLDIFNNTNLYINIAKNFIDNYIFNYDLIQESQVEVDYKYLKDQLILINNNNKITKTKELKDKIINSNIEFSKYGWIQEVSKILNISPQKVSQWMKKNMFEFYEEKCFKRK